MNKYLKINGVYKNIYKLALEIYNLKCTQISNIIIK